jgi:hypothetical protein
MYAAVARMHSDPHLAPSGPPLGLIHMSELQCMRMCGSHAVIFAFARLPLCKPCVAAFTGCETFK